MGCRPPQFPGHSGCLRYCAKEKGINGQSFFLDGHFRSSHFHSDCPGNEENAERAVALFLEVFCFPCPHRAVDCLDHVSVSHDVIRTSDTRQFIFYWGPAILYAGVIFLLSSFSDVPDIPKKSDKILHFIEYFLFALLLWRAVARERFWTFDKRRMIGVLLLGSLYAASDEIHQSCVPGRYASIFDWFADVAGILGMITLMVLTLKWRGRRRQSYETI